ncbi:4-hydroxyphenylpyruvate dioxygenase [Plasticicumulans lactativorans]|uniref:3-dehydroshikimate dehydratase n=1 Tax=Plasticicumulans lactativorans TaxID=1133106 RepID=A0A4R2KWX9_9GAMM|nr:sugar phosphate isomerase/epimerase and 4-hydroxyphenylpyruvate domain-containing protein [Plasticicumulans lactativorans]TCO75799.1 4-hydroxyphenylpyruvate dioxygenase [Plasticicumulans lactativorans]
MRHAIATVSLSGTLPEKLEAVAAAGFDGVEIFENDLLYFDGSPRDVRRIVADLGMEVSLFQPFRDFEGCRRDRLQQNLDRAERKFDLMGELGTDRILVCSSVSPDVIRDDEVLIEDLARLAERAARRGIVIGYEALAWGRYVNSYRHAWKLVKAVDHPNLGVLLDSFHTLSIDDDLSLIQAIPAEKIAFVQLADAPRMAMDVLEWSRHHRCFPGQGDFDLAGFVAPIMATGYQGWLSLEVFNDGFRAAPTGRTAADGLRSLLYLEEKTGQRLAASARATFTRPPQAATEALFQPPAVSAYDGIEFLEFAVDGAAAARLGEWFRQLGFRVAGTHRSKDVTLFRHGAINLILNAEPDSFAREHFAAHGPSLCALALRVDDAERAAERARQFRYELFAGRVGPNERRIPAVRAPDGSLVYLVDQQPNAASIYESDFELRADAGDAAPALLTRIDYVALGIAVEELDNWIMFFRSSFGFDTGAPLTLPDPYGLVRSRAVRSTDGSVHVPLMTSTDRDTAVSRLLRTYRGSGLQRIVLATDDIFAAVRAARDNGVAILDIPRNYYDDLDARYALEPGFLARMAEANVLYDRDESGGEFLHAYTALCEERFFFELTERRGGYTQHGAVNAAVRMAALVQARRRAVAGPD